ncbi:uncharacterized protein LOC124922738 [Impatiens glandulifera]|uniref:uncharacterized protein LOC124922738 n=1 Tax=Impatiens glandulifera TaxID=253017 RepID=UPI001FB16E7F|nr:uncharacterized protein LOC124922738 [Impatiens glandulifera]
MNSMFSSFDALCAEVMGHSFKNSFPSLKNNPVSNGDQQRSEEANMKGKPSPPPPPTADGTGGRKKKVVSARFAPELDGLNCFETLVSF